MPHKARRATFSWAKLTAMRRQKPISVGFILDCGRASSCKFNTQTILALIPKRISPSLQHTASARRRLCVQLMAPALIHENSAAFNAPAFPANLS